MDKILTDEDKIIGDILRNEFRITEIGYYYIYLISKYLIWECGFKEDKLRDFIRGFSEDVDKNFNWIKNRDLVNAAIKNAKKSNIKKLNKIIITIDEIHNIEKLKNFKYQKFAYLMLVCCKRNYKSNDDKYYYFRNYDKLISYLYGKRISRKEMIDFHKTLLKKGLIEIFKPGYKFNNFELLLFAKDDSEAAIVLENISDNLILQKYLDYYGGESIVCLNCEKIVLRNSNSQKYCGECQKKKLKERKKEDMRRIRKIRNG